MNIDETRLWIKTTSARFPGLGDFFAKADAPEVPKIIADWAAAVENVAPEAASRFLQAMVAGEVEMPKWPAEWATLPATLRRWARENAPPDMSLPNYKKAADDPTYRCLACRDRGYGVEVFNRDWVRHHEIEIENGLEGDWWESARRWCRQHGGGPFIGATDCAECERGRKQISARKSPGGGGYVKGQLCLVPGGGPDAWAKALREFVKEYPMIEQSEWNPNMDYEEVTGNETY